MYQKWTAIGNLGNDVEMRYTPSGTPVANFRFAVNEQWTAADGSKQEKATWFKVTAWGKLAEIVSKFCVKGQQIFVEGKITGSSAYLDKTGQPAASTDVKAETIKFLGSRKDSSQGSDYEGGAAPSSELRDEDIPF